MKKLIYSSLFIISGLAFVSCNDESEEIVPQTNVEEVMLTGTEGETLPPR